MEVFGATLDITLLDLIALGWFGCCWFGYLWFCRFMLKKRNKACLARVMHAYRYDWMVRILEREVRVADATIMTHLERNGAFFASSSLLILAALFTMLGASDQAITVVSELPFASAATQQEWELKVMLLIAIFVYAFFTFTWSMRQYNFGAILIGSAPVPNEQDISSGAKKAFATHVADVIDLAANQFNYGLRAYYFALAVLGWFFSAWVFIFATIWVVAVLYRREFHSSTLKAMMAARDPSRTFRGLIR